MKTNPPICKDCRHIVPTAYPVSSGPMCGHPLTQSWEPVHGYRMDYCSNVRRTNNACGPQGILWHHRSTMSSAPRPVWWRRLLINAGLI